MGTYERFLETEVLTADPVALVRMLYRGAIDSIASARQHLAAGNVVERSNQVAKAHAILHELSTSLNTSAGGEIASNLRELYDYMQRQLNAANLQQVDAPMADVETLLRNLLGAWVEIGARQNASPIAPEQETYVPLSLAG
ncbi:MAG: flagellar export chaperone FliS [Bryobacteraceae bacterium]